MNSKIVHKWERVYYSLVSILLALILVKFIGFFISNVKIIAWTTLLGILCMMGLFITTITIYFKGRSWRREGNQLTKKIGLEAITLMPSNLLGRSNCVEFEVHHTPETVIKGLGKKKFSKKEIMIQLDKTLQKDFEKLFNWSQDYKTKNEHNTILFHTTTHNSMINLWSRSSEKYFYVKEMEQKLDPYAKMNLIQWLAASFSTTGRINLKKPKIWKSYYFYRRQEEVKQA